VLATVALLREDYAHFLRAPELLAANLDRLQGMYANELLAHWHALCKAQSWDEFIAGLLEQHYDPTYSQSIFRNYLNYDRARVLALNSLSKQEFNRPAEEALALPDNFVNNGGNSQEF